MGGWMKTITARKSLSRPFALFSVKYQENAAQAAFLLFLLHCALGLERIIFANELLVLLGIYFFIANHRYYLNLKSRDNLYLAFFGFLAYGAVLGAVSFPLRQSSIYEYLRTLPLAYSCCTFFVGANIYHLYKDNIQHLRIFFALTLLALVWKESLSIGSWAIFPFTLSHWNLLYSFLFGVAIASLLTSKSLTFLAFVGFSAYLWIFNAKRWKIMFSFGTFLTPILLALALLVVNYLLFFHGFLKYTYDYTAWLMDSNTAWRLTLWSHILCDLFAESPLLGIGFGSRIFEHGLYFVSFGSSHDAHLPFTMGAHNSFLQLLARMGIVGTFFILALYRQIFKHINDIIDDFDLRGLFYSFMLLTIAALFNVVLETPLYAGIYWTIVGMLWKGLSEPKACKQNSHLTDPSANAR